jgi:hypothetical protein
MICGKKVGKYSTWFVSKIYNILTRMLFPKLKVSDMNSVKAFRRDVYNDLPTLREGWHRYLPVFAVSRGYMVREIPVNLNKRHSGESKFKGKSRIFKGLTDLIAVKFQLSMLGDPMHAFGKYALFFFVLGILVAGAAFYLRFGLNYGYRPLLYAVILLELSALITLVMGIIVESMVYLRDSLSEVRDENKLLTEKVEKLVARVGKSTSSRGGGDDDSGSRHSKSPRHRKPSSRGSSSGRSSQESSDDIRPRPLTRSQTEESNGG